MNDHDINELNKKIMSYVTKCYLDAFKSEGREYDPHLWSFEYILIKDIGISSSHILEAYRIEIIRPILYRI